MRSFGGFSVDKSEMVSLPKTFFSEVLPRIDSLGELKVTLFLFWLLQQRKGFPKCVSLAELKANQTLRDGLRVLGSPRPPEDSLNDGLESAVGRGTLLHLVTTTSQGSEDWYFVNTPVNRRVIQELENGKLASGKLLGSSDDQETRVLVDRLNIFALYEQNIGLLTPMIAEQLREAEGLYPEAWIEEAFGEAVAYNRRSWRYVQRILENWAIRGRDSAKDRRGRRFDP